MVPHGWRQKAPVGEALLRSAPRFSFLQAVRLLEEMFPERTPVGEGVDPSQEPVRFRSRVALDHPPSDIQSLATRDPETSLEWDGPPLEMEVNVLGLAGALGPLPTAFTEQILDRARERDPAMQDFLDVFNHRLVSMLFRARKKYRPALDRRPPEEGRLASCAFALMGLGTPRLQGRLGGVPDRGLLRFAGLLAGQRSMVGLARLLEGYFAAQTTVEPFQGGWQELEEDQRTRLGVDGAHQVLGESAFLGRRFWDQHAGFGIVLGPLDLSAFVALLPGTESFEALCALVRFYVGRDFRFTVKLHLLAEEIPETRLGAAADARLGWSAALGSPTDPESPTASGLRLGSAGDARLGWTSWLGTPPSGQNGEVELAVPAAIGEK